MIKYVPASKNVGLSTEFFALSRPSAVRIAGEVTQFLCATKKDLKGGLWVVLDDQRRVKVHEKADLEGIAKLVRPLIAAGALAANTLEILQQKLDAGRGGWINVFDSLPDEIKAEAKTWKQMIAAGLLVDEYRLNV